MAGMAVRVILVAIAVIAFTDQSARAGSPSTQPSGERQPPTLETLVRNLGNPDPRVHESARVTLLRLGRDDLPDLKRALKKSRPLLPSQAAAIRAIVRQVYLSGEEYKTEGQGFLGILMGPNSDADFVPDNEGRGLGVVVTDRIPGFTAGRGLIDGDIILGKANPFIPFRDSNDLKRVIAPTKPGMTVLLSVLRQGEIIVVPLKPDPNPVEIQTVDQIPSFIADRDKRFEEYWKREFADLLNTRVAG